MSSVLMSSALSACRVLHPPQSIKVWLTPEQGGYGCTVIVRLRFLLRCRWSMGGGRCIETLISGGLG